MNLIVNRQLDGAQKQVIYELTLKKRQSKKSTMSEKQVAARQQLARELMQERKIPPNPPPDGSHQSYHRLAEENPIESHNICNNNYKTTDCDSADPTATTTTTTTSTTTNTIDDRQSLEELPSTSSITNLTRTNLHLSTDESTGSCCSFCRSDSSYSGSSQDSGLPSSSHHHRHITTDTNTITTAVANHQLLISELDRRQADELLARKKEASLKFNRCRLEHLNSELERRLHQYEYLMAQEKALLGTYNMKLFAKQGVNNFHLSKDDLRTHR